jgi:hypothetical protein
MMILSVQRERDFQRRVLEHVSKYAPGATRKLSPEELLRRVELSVARARKAGFATELGIVNYVSFMFVLGPLFDQHPTVSAVLQDKSLPLEERLDVLPSRLSQRDWRQLVQSSPASWNTLS